jgi:hypothetical protein
MSLTDDKNALFGKKKTSSTAGTISKKSDVTASTATVTVTTSKQSIPL